MFGDKQISIGMITWDYVPSIGGMGRHVAALASGLAAAGHRLSVFSRFDCPLPFGRSVLFSFFLPFLLPRFIRENQPDLLHAHAGPGGVFLLRKPKGLPLIVTANHTYADQVRHVGQRWKRLLIPFERRTYCIADAILCLSEDTVQSLINDYGIAREKLTVIPCGIDVTRFSRGDRPIAQRKHACVFVGRGDHRKGFDLLSSAWDIVEREVPDAHLSVVGILGLSSFYRSFHASCDEDELAVLLGSSRVVVCPSRLEGFGLVAAEAIAAGTPVVATDVPGLRRTVTDRRTGFLASLDPRDIAANIILLLTDDLLWERLHQGCREQRGEFESALEIKRHLAVYSRLNAGKNARSCLGTYE